MLFNNLFFFVRTTRLISIEPGTKHPWEKLKGNPSLFKLRATPLFSRRLDSGKIAKYIHAESKSTFNGAAAMAK